MVVGKNKVFKNVLEKRDFGRKIVVYGFIDFIDKLMVISDIFIIKFGGFICVEVLLCKFFMILILFISG